ncbi:cystine knot domain-containing protein [Tieghemostelium lacteum]|uniref:Cystine knot domain-containing protein n=1 Tax=Tieghemostelium lacteum TaxID=361077 RepID=A0A151Z6F7_TIELA|nr:cystine knot domain-containing protein [Tieghemostelium lacteum]|eukprot:KYQ89518.1 cystine knot domain-containing protein [Tieghemostelium lacteum]
MAITINRLSFMKLSFDPKNGIGLTVKICDDKEAEKERKKIIAVSTITGMAVGAGIGFGVGAVGGAVGGVIVGCIAGSAVKGVVIGAVAVGGLGIATAGAIEGTSSYNSACIKVANLKNDVTMVKDQMQQTAPIIELIIKGFYEKYMKNPPNGITCDITREPIVIPAKVDCGSIVDHVFEYEAIIRWDSDFCPKCRKAINLNNLEIHEDTGKRVLMVAGELIKKMETILQSLPSNLFSDVPNFENANLISKVKDALHVGNTLFDNQNEMIEKIKNPDTLSLEEAYALAYYIATQFYGNIRAIRKMRDLADGYLRIACDMGNITEQSFNEKRREISDWSRDMIQKLIPNECTTMKKLISLR